MTAQNTLLSMEGVRKRFGDKDALSSLSFSVREGEVFGFLGPSGAGKTTTIKVLTRQLLADAGEITLFGKPLDKLAQQAYDEVGVLTDNSGLYDRLTVYDNLLLFAEIKRLPKAKVDEALEAVELADARLKKAKTLSRGMRQRAMLACAIMHGPRLLFLDEPTASLDPGTSLQIHKLLRRLNSEGTTIFLTTHNMEEADKLCDRVAFLNNGVIAACDTPDALKVGHAKNEATARTKKGAVHAVEKTAQGLRSLADRLEADGDALLTLHSKEPNLEEIFLSLTGRDLS